MDVLLLSRNVAIYSSRRLTETFRSRGANVTVLDPVALSLTVGDGSPGLFADGVPLPPPAVAVPRIGTGITDHALAVLRHLEVAGVPLLAGSNAVRRAKDKMECLQALTAAGLPVPPTALARQASDADRAIDLVGGPPVVLKFLAGTHGVGVFLAESRESARSILEAMWEMEKNLLVQRFIAAASGTDLRLFVVGNRVVAAMRRRAAEGGFRSNLHHGGRAEAYLPDEPTIDVALRAARALDLRVAGVDLLETGDGLLVNEVNASPGLEGIEDLTGIDIASAVVDEAISIARVPRGHS